MDLQNIKTKSGKTIKDFVIPEELIENDTALVELIMRSESMNDEERQYWFNLTAVMDEEQIEKLRDILTRERAKLEEIEARYGEKEKLTPEQIAARNAEIKAKRESKQQELAAKEASLKEEENEEDILSELENL